MTTQLVIVIVIFSIIPYLSFFFCFLKKKSVKKRGYFFYFCAFLTPCSLISLSILSASFAWPFWKMFSCYVKNSLISDSKYIEWLYGFTFFLCTFPLSNLQKQQFRIRKHVTWKAEDGLKPSLLIATWSAKGWSNTIRL